MYAAVAAFPFPAPLTAENVNSITLSYSAMMWFCPLVTKGSLKSSDNGHILGNVQSALMGILLHSYVLILLHKI